MFVAWVHFRDRAPASTCKLLETLIISQGATFYGVAQLGIGLLYSQAASRATASGPEGRVSTVTPGAFVGVTFQVPLSMPVLGTGHLSTGSLAQIHTLGEHT